MRTKCCVSILFLLALFLSQLSDGPCPLLSVAADGDDQAAIQTLVEAMTEAVFAQDRDTYLSYVDLSDPVFALEHSRWVDEWATTTPVDRFSLAVDNIRVRGEEATAKMTMKWALRPDTSYVQADYPVRFTRDSGGTWRYAGEYWIMYEAGVKFRVLFTPGREDVAYTLIDLLPDVYDHVTDSLHYQPSDVTEIKLYENSEAIVANTLLSLPPISGWNEPGESLKLVIRPDDGYMQSVLAHELTHKLTFDMAGTAHGQFPWWVEEGIAQYVASEYWEYGRASETLAAVIQWQEHGQLADWDTISDFKTTPQPLWRYVYPQGFAFIVYVTETFGESARNDWLRDMAGEMDVYAASEAVFDQSFETLVNGFEAWLITQAVEAQAG